jgi:restriction system protein
VAIPDYQTIMRPLLEIASERDELTRATAVELVSDHFNLTAEERRRLMAKVKRPIIMGRVHFAQLYLSKAGLLESVRRGVFRITPLGREVLSCSDRIDTRYLMQFESFAEFMQRSKRRRTPTPAASGTMPSEEQAPQEVLESAFEEVQAQLAEELLDAIKSASPQFFEKLVVELLLSMGYGGSWRDAAEVLGQSHDGGIDGVVNQDRLGLDAVYIQAKRWDGSSVGRKEIQSFVGSLSGKKASKGVFVTTLSFTKEAKDFVTSIDKKIVLIDGLRLAELMIEHDVGVSTTATYRVKSVDSDYFN